MGPRGCDADHAARLRFMSFTARSLTLRSSAMAVSLS